MTNLEILLLEKFNDLQAKMSLYKTLPVRFNLPDLYRSFILRQSPLFIYSSWEGFVKNSLSIYLQELNLIELNYDDIDSLYLGYQVDKICQFKANITSNDTIVKKSEQLFSLFSLPVFFDTKINTESNANLKVVNSLLKKFGLNEIDKKYETPLNKLLLFRNSLAHGDDGIEVSEKDCSEFTLLIENLAVELINSITKGFCEKVYLK